MVCMYSSEAAMAALHVKFSEWNIIIIIIHSVHIYPSLHSDSDWLHMCRYVRLFISPCHSSGEELKVPIVE